MAKAKPCTHKARCLSPRKEMYDGTDERIEISSQVVLTSLRVDTQLSTLINRSSKSAIILSCIEVVCIVLGIVDMLFRSVAPQSFLGNLKLRRTIAKAHETEDPKQQADRFCTDILDCSYVDGLKNCCQQQTGTDFTGTKSPANNHVTNSRNQVC